LRTFFVTRQPDAAWPNEIEQSRHVRTRLLGRCHRCSLALAADSWPLTLMLLAAKGGGAAAKTNHGTNGRSVAIMIGHPCFDKPRWATLVFRLWRTSADNTAGRTNMQPEQAESGGPPCKGVPRASASAVSVRKHFSLQGTAFVTTELTWSAMAQARFFQRRSAVLPYVCSGSGSLL